MKKDLSEMETNAIEIGHDGGCWRFNNLFVVASWEGGWDHVSVSTRTRCPTWQEMESIRFMFFEPEETVMQFHPPASKAINCHPHCLHMWRNQNADVELPPSWMIGPQSK